MKFIMNFEEVSLTQAYHKHPEIGLVNWDS